MLVLLLVRKWKDSVGTYDLMVIAGFIKIHSVYGYEK
jgi:hypothetical protein